MHCFLFTMLNHVSCQPVCLKTLIKHILGFTVYINTNMFFISMDINVTGVNWLDDVKHVHGWLDI